VLSGFFAGTALVANGQVPVITGPPDLDIVATNEAFNPATNAWTTRLPMPTARDSFAISEVNGKIYVVGGQIINNCIPIDTLEAYDPATDAWTGLTSMPTARFFAGAGTVNRKMYVIGGQLGCGGAVRTVEVYDPSTDTWSTAADMPTARHSVGVAVIHDTTLNRDVLYAIGGATNNGSVNVPVNTVEAFDPMTNSWTTKTSMLQERFQPVIGVVNGKIYAIGGFDTTFSQASDKTVEAFDPVTNAWTMKTSMPTARGVHPAGGVANNIIYVAGGIDQINLTPETSLTTVEAYHSASDTWSTAPDMPSPRTGLGIAIVNNKLYAVGGNTPGIARVGQPFIYQITATNHPTEYSQSGLPADLNFDTALGIVYGTPTSPSDSPVTFQATNGAGTGPPATKRLVVLPDPTSGLRIVSSTCATGRTGQPFSFRVLTKGDSPATRFTVGGLPYKHGVGPELTIDPVTGVISGTPTSLGNFSVTLTVTDGSLETHATLQLTFISDPTVPIVNSSSDAIITPGSFFSLRLRADASSPIFKYIGTDGLEHQGQTSAGLPPGLSFDGIDTISGVYSPTPTPTPTLLADFTSDARRVSTTAPDTIKIRPAFAVEPIATNPDGTGVAPLNFFVTGPPIVTTNPATLIASFSATLNGSLNPDGLTTSVHFQYGTTTNYDFTTANQSYTGITNRNVSASISGLIASTVYHYRIVATNSAGTTFGGDRMFTTLSATGSPVVASSPATLIASFSAKLNGSLDPHGLTTSVHFRYGTTTGYGLTTAPQSQNGNTYRNASANISSLTASTTYHFRIVASNSAGTRFGSDKTFTTLSGTGPPVVTTNAATSVTSSSATLNGSLDPHGLPTTVSFRWGTTTSYGHTTPMLNQTGNTYRNIAANISGLSTHTTYHFRIVATNSAGTRLGSDRTFTTP
jgi:N-acetylneuraminic acid mutarotase